VTRGRGPDRMITRYMHHMLYIQDDEYSDGVKWISLLSAGAMGRFWDTADSKDPPADQRVSDWQRDPDDSLDGYLDEVLSELWEAHLPGQSHPQVQPWSHRSRRRTALPLR
jgi:hypothetical protein